MSNPSEPPIGAPQVVSGDLVSGDVASGDVASGDLAAPDAGDAGVEPTPVNTEMEDLPASECWKQLRTTPVGRLAVRGEGDDVEIFPVNYVVDHGSVVFRTAAGTKLDRILATGQVTFEADDSDLDDGIAWSVIAKGPCTVIEIHRDVLDSFDIEVYPWHAGGKPTFVRLVPNQLTGRRFSIDPASLR